MGSDKPGTPIPLSAPDITEEEEALLLETLRSGMLSRGPRVSEFEQLFSQFLDGREAVAVSSGTAALHLSLLAAGIGPRDSVITTPLTFVATANAILYTGATPVFVDVEPSHGNIDPRMVSEFLDRPPKTVGRVQALLPVHLFGQPCEMDSLASLAERHGLKIIEDACEALGSEYRGRRAGTLGDAATFGFYPNKQLTTGEGGIVTTCHHDWAARIRALRNHGRYESGEYLPETGFNYRLDDLSAAVGCAQMRRFDDLLEKRSRVAGWYSDRLRDLERVILPEAAPTTTRTSWFVYVLRFPDQKTRDAVMAFLARWEIPSRVYFQPLHRLPYFREMMGAQEAQYPVAESWGDTALAVPFSGTMQESMVDSVCRRLRSALETIP